MKEEFPKAPSGKSPLEYFEGSFEGYQLRFYRTLRQAFSSLNSEMRDIHNRRANLVGFFDSPEYLSEARMNVIGMPCGGATPLEILGKPQAISNEDRGFWEVQISENGPLSAGPELTVERYLAFLALTQSDRITEEKNAQGIRPYGLEVLAA